MINQKLPTAPSQRVEIVDIVRGFAVFGILLSNILIISGFLFTPFTDLAQFKSASLNDTLYLISQYVVSGKFYPLFCILFGYGFYMQVAKYNSGEKSFVRYFLWRLFILLIIGILHQLIWPGDVVTTYALVGFLFLLARKTTAKLDVIFAVIFFLIYLGVGLYPWILSLGSNEVHEAVKPLARFQFPGVDNLTIIDKVRNEGVSGMYYFYFPQYKFLWSFARLRFTTHSIIALFFIGGYLYKTDFFNSSALKIRNLIIFLVLGAIGNYLWFNVAYAFRIIDNLFLSLFYMSLLSIIFKTNLGAKILRFMIPMGRMALTCYILQSVLSIFVFYGFGLGLFAKLPLYQVFLIAFGILAIEAVLCSLWLKKFKFGPIEWAWRCLSYKKWIPIKL